MALLVEAWDKNMICTDRIAHALTDDLGAFQIEIAEAHLTELFMERRPELLFKVFRDETLLGGPGELVFWNPYVGEAEIILEVNIATAPEEPMESVLFEDKTATGSNLSLSLNA